MVYTRISRDFLGMCKTVFLSFFCFLIKLNTITEKIVRVQIDRVQTDRVQTDRVLTDFSILVEKCGKF